MSKSPIIEGVVSNSILSHWGSIKPHLQRILDKIDSGHTVDDVKKRLLTCEMQLWNINNWQAVAITQICVLPQYNNLVVVYLVGDGVKTWLSDLTSLLTQYAKYHKCKYIEFYGREGWLKVANQVGFKKSFNVMRLDINGQ